MNKYSFINNCGLKVCLKQLVCQVITMNNSSLSGWKYLVVLEGLGFESCICHWCDVIGYYICICAWNVMKHIMACWFLGNCVDQSSNLGQCY